MYLLQRPEDIPPRLSNRLTVRIAVLATLVVAAVAMVIFRLWSLQVLSGEHYRSLAKNNGILNIRNAAALGGTDVATVTVTGAVGTFTLTYNGQTTSPLPFNATAPQVRAMYGGDHSRKITLVEHGFRLPSALDNRPLRFDEWEKFARQVLFVSATPGPYELTKSAGVVVEQVIRPTGLVDPPVEVMPVKGQIDDLRLYNRPLTRTEVEDLAVHLPARVLLAEVASDSPKEIPTLKPEKPKT